MIGYLNQQYQKDFFNMLKKDLAVSARGSLGGVSIERIVKKSVSINTNSTKVFFIEM